MSDTNEPSAWEEINPPMVSARRRELQSRSLERLAPASADDFRNELTACLTLVAPVGMTEEAKRDWLAVAWGTLKHLPADLLSLGCARARQVCDHPSKIVPTIVAATEQGMKWRREALCEPDDSLRLPSPDRCTAQQAAEILREVGLKPDYDALQEQNR